MIATTLHSACGNSAAKAKNANASHECSVLWYRGDVIAKGVNMHIAAGPGRNKFLRNLAHVERHVC